MVTRETRAIRALVIGASAGAIGALGALLPELPAGTRFPVLVVVHVPPDAPSLLVSIFARRCALPVREPVDKQPILPGIWFAPANYHMLVESDGSFSLSVDEPVNFSRPSVDVLFESAADVYGAALAAVILTGASRDGARGARAVQAVGGFVAVQDPKTAEDPTMPLAAIELFNPELVAPLPDIAQLLRSWALAGEL